jgi:hypothetical protein
VKTTPVYALPYPESSDHTRTWEYWQALADRLEAVLPNIDASVAQFSARPTAAVTTNPAGAIPLTATLNRGGFGITAAGVTVPFKGVYSLNWRAAAGATAASQICTIRIDAPGRNLAWGQLLCNPGVNGKVDVSAVAELNAGELLVPYAQFPGDLHGVSAGFILSAFTGVLEART